MIKILENITISALLPKRKPISHHEQSDNSHKRNCWRYGLPNRGMPIQGAAL
jgi:hypothetical protein